MVHCIYYSCNKLDGLPTLYLVYYIVKLYYNCYGNACYRLHWSIKHYSYLWYTFI